MRVGIISGDITGKYFVKTLNHVYPVFKVEYEEEKKIILEKLNPFENIYIGGRSGLFEYINMDQAINMEMNIAKK